MGVSLNQKFAALADPTRRAILLRLAQGDATVTQLQKPFAISQPAISKHLKVLESAGLIERASHEAVNDGTFIIQHVFSAPRQRVWDAWTQPDQLSRWFGPKGVKTVVKAYDLCPGGMLHSCMETPDGVRMWAKLVYREVVALSRLVWIHAFSDEHANVVRAPFFDGKWPLELLTTLTFADADAGTQITLIWTPFNATDVERQTFIANMTSMNHGWTSSFDALDTFLAGA